MKQLVIVESPTKAKTIGQYLGKDYIVTSSYGHVRDLPKSSLGVDPANNFTPEYIIPETQAKRMKELKAAAKGVDGYLLATDPDREGEAISWHLVEALKLPADKVKRIVFHEITKEAILEAMNHPRPLDTNLVDAQQARRVLDRIVGYKLSPLLWKKIRYGLSAGRVQSVAVRLIVERERERRAFVPKEYWSVDALVAPENQPDAQFVAQLQTENGKKIEVSTKTHADEIVAILEKAAYTVAGVTKSERKRNPAPPFTTSTLQQRAANRFGWNGKKTMQVAQKLYEHGHITYMRTDSLNLSPQAISAARQHIQQAYGATYLPGTPNLYKTKSKGAQEAHEAIRPSKPDVTIAQLGSKLTPDEAKLYQLIWQRMLASQMVPAIVDQVSVDINADKYGLRATGSTVKFPGWLAVYGVTIKPVKSDDDDEDATAEAEEEKLLPELAQDQPLDLKELLPEQHFTQPPPRFTDATLVKELEEDGIGRPSTYAPTISTIIARQYVEREGRALKPTDTAEVVNDLLVKHFPDIVDMGFTSEMEEELDDIADGKLAWVPVVRNFYEPFEAQIKVKDKEIKKEDVISEKTEEVCDVCGKPMVIKLGRYGKFLSCSDFPTCKNAKPLLDLEDLPAGDEQIGEDMEGKKIGTELDENGMEVKKISEDEVAIEKVLDPCPKDGGQLVVKQGRFGIFIACANYPKCKYTKAVSSEEIKAKCPRDGAEIQAKRTKRGKIFFGCANYPKCDWASWTNPDDDPSVLTAEPAPAKGKAKTSKTTKAKATKATTSKAKTTAKTTKAKAVKKTTAKAKKVTSASKAASVTGEPAASAEVVT